MFPFMGEAFSPSLPVIGDTYIQTPSPISWARGGGEGAHRVPQSHLVINCQHFQKVPVRVTEIYSAAAIIVIDTHVLRVKGPTAICNIFRFQPGKYLIEFRLAYLERIMMGFKLLPIIKIQRQRFVHLHHDEMRKLSNIIEAEDS